MTCTGEVSVSEEEVRVHETKKCSGGGGEPNGGGERLWNGGCGVCALPLARDTQEVSEAAMGDHMCVWGDKCFGVASRLGAQHAYGQTLPRHESQLSRIAQDQATIEVVCAGEGSGTCSAAETDASASAFSDDNRSTVSSIASNLRRASTKSRRKESSEEGGALPCETLAKLRMS